jgi:hypothetical protein
MGNEAKQSMQNQQSKTKNVKENDAKKTFLESNEKCNVNLSDFFLLK